MRARLPALGSGLNEDRGLCASAGYYLCNHARLRITCVICERAYENRAAVLCWIYNMAGALDTAASITFACCCCMLHAAAAIVATNTEMSHVQIHTHQ